MCCVHDLTWCSDTVLNSEIWILILFLTEALKEVAEIATQLQSSLIRLENFQKLTELQRDLIGIENLTAPGRVSETEQEGRGRWKTE